MKNTAKNREIAEVLSGFGLGQNERAVYLALLPMGQAQLTPIAHRAGLPATTTQSILARLVDTGVVLVSKRKSRSVYEADDPAVLKRILERRAAEVAGIVPLLAKLKGDAGADARIAVYERERMTDIFHQALAAKHKIVHEIVAARDLQDILGEKFHFTRRRMEKGVRLRSLRVESREIKKYAAATHQRELREAKFLPKELHFKASVMFWDDTVAFFTTKDEGLAWVVRSKACREMVEQIFELLWSVSRKMETA